MKGCDLEWRVLHREAGCSVGVVNLADVLPSLLAPPVVRTLFTEKAKAATAVAPFFVFHLGYRRSVPIGVVPLLGKVGQSDRIPKRELPPL